MTLLETLVSLALGLLVLAAVLSQDAASSRSARLLAAQAQMAEDAQIALHLLTSELAMAGFAQPQSLYRTDDGLLRWRTALPESALLACDTGFAAPSSPAPLSCAAQGHSAAFAVRYQADADNTVPLAGSRTPSDCLGYGLTAERGVYLTENRWFVATSGERSELRCASRLGNPGQPLVDNVEALALRFGHASASSPRQSVRYLSARQVDDWARVRSVRLCLLLRSSQALLVPADDARYWDCQGQPQVSSDGRLRRAFHASVALRGHGSP